MKKLYSIIYLLTFSILLTGCSSHDTDGFFYNTFTKNMDMFLSYLYSLVNNWGLAVIIITLIVKGIILPFMLRNYKRQRTSSINMEKAKPELEIVQQKISKLREIEKKTVSSEERLKFRMELAELQKEIFAIYKKYDCSPAITGNLLPVLIQAPFVTALYFVLQNPIYSKDILGGDFLTIQLGEKSIIILVLVFLIYMLVGKATKNMMQNNQITLDTPESQKMANISKNTVWITPIMLTFITYTSIAAIGIYFVVSGFLVFIQILLGKKLYPPYTPKQKQEKEKKVKLVKR